MKGLRSRYNTDPEGARAIADKLVKNTYRTFMTRRMKDCYVYCCDKALGEYLKSCIASWLAISDNQGKLSFRQIS